MSLFTAFGIIPIQKARKKNEKKRKATMVIKLVSSVRFLLKNVFFIIIILPYSAFWYLGLFSAVPRFTVALIITTILLASPVYRMSRIVLSIKSTVLNLKWNILTLLT